MKFATLPLLIAFALTVQAASDHQEKQYKKQNRDQIINVAQKNPEKAVAYAEKYLKKYPKDLEADYIEVLAHSKLGNPDEAAKTMERSLKKGLPLDRYLAGPRNLLAPLYKTDAFKKRLAAYNSELIHGPHLGAVTANSAKFWVRTINEVPIEVRVSATAAKNTVHTGKGHTVAQADYTATVDVTGLQPNTTYTYELVIAGKRVELTPQPTFRTQLPAGKVGKFTIGFGGGAGFTPWQEYMWDNLAKERFAAFLMLGDNVYIDTPTCKETQQYCYYRRQSRPEYRRFSASTSVYAVWDDHDFGGNDCTSSQSLESPSWKGSVLDVFTENWVNPTYGNADAPGVWHKLTIADVDFFLLDGRFYRQDPKKIKKPSMLGPAQKKWLKDGLKNSTAAFKMICSPVPMVPETKGKSLDTWDGFPEEREEIFSFIESEKINGVVILAADRHRHDAWQIKRPKGYNLYEFMSSRLTNIHSHPILSHQTQCLFGVGGLGYGRVTFDTTLDDPTVTYEIINAKGKVPMSQKTGDPRPCRITLKRSQLTH